jgi:hypothetical protein
MKATKALAEFAHWALENGPFDGCDLGGEDVQDRAVALGLIERAKDRPDWWVYTEDFKAALNSSLPSNFQEKP